MGTPDPRLNAQGNVDFRLTTLWRAWSQADDPPTRVKPIPLTLVARVCHYTDLENTAASHAAQTCLILAMFFLLRPGEYLGTPSVTHFRFRDLRFWIGARALEHRTCADAKLQAATFVTLTFTRQKMEYATIRLASAAPVTHGSARCMRLSPVFCNSVPWGRPMTRLSTLSVPLRRPPGHTSSHSGDTPAAP